MGEKGSDWGGGMMELHVKVRISTGWFIISCHNYYTCLELFFSPCRDIQDIHHCR